MPKLLNLCTAPEAWSRNSNWIGYVAVSTDEEKIKQLGRRDILIAWRGTVMDTEWAADAQINLVPSGIDSRPSYNLTTAALRVEMGFLNLYTSKNSETRYNKTSARQQVNALLVYIHVDLAPISCSAATNLLVSTCCYDLLSSFKEDACTNSVAIWTDDSRLQH